MPAVAKVCARNGFPGQIAGYSETYCRRTPVAELRVLHLFACRRDRDRGRFPCLAAEATGTAGGVRAILRALFPRRVLYHRSTIADLGYYLIGALTLGALLGWAIVSAGKISDLVVSALVAGLGRPAPVNVSETALRFGRTVALFIGYELGFYVDHSLKHRIPALWELHKTHHSAEVLTPLTNFRVHPLDSLMLANMLAIFTGVFGGLFAYCVGRPVAIFTIDGANILFIVYIFLTANLQHSQVWIPAKGLVGRLFMSPAHHQIHHSSDPAHFNRNLGASLAVWDWLFGTLAIPERESPGLTYGVAEIANPHSATTLVVTPVVNALRALLRRPAPETQALPEGRERDFLEATKAGTAMPAGAAERRVAVGR